MFSSAKNSENLRAESPHKIPNTCKETGDSEDENIFGTVISSCAVFVTFLLTDFCFPSLTFHVFNLLFLFSV
jgi:hypothetical protein